MGLSQKYDQFYRTDMVVETLQDFVVRTWPANRIEAIVSEPGTGARLLDVGCGNGLLLYQFRHRYTELIGLEYSESRLAQASLNLTGLIFKPLCGSAENMIELANESIDRIISADTIEHIPDIYLATAEMFRVLKSGGQLVINTPNIAFIKKRMMLLLGRFPSTSQPNEGLGSDVLFDGGHLHYFTFRSLSLLLERVGFRVEKWLGYGQFGRIHNFRPTLLSGGAQVVAIKP